MAGEGERYVRMTDKMNKHTHSRNRAHTRQVPRHTKAGAHSEGKGGRGLHTKHTRNKNTSWGSCQEHLLCRDTGGFQPSAQKTDLHSPLVLSHELGGKLAEDVQESQVERRVAFSLGTGILEGKLYTIPGKWINGDGTRPRESSMRSGDMHTDC